MKNICCKTKYENATSEPYISIKNERSGKRIFSDTRGRTLKNAEMKEYITSTRDKECLVFNYNRSDVEKNEILNQLFELAK